MFVLDIAHYKVLDITRYKVYCTSSYKNSIVKRAIVRAILGCVDLLGNIHTLLCSRILVPHGINFYLSFFLLYK